MAGRGSWLLVAGLVLRGALGAAVVLPECPGGATLAIVVDNLSSVESLSITVDGELSREACRGGSIPALSAYHAEMTCAGYGTATCVVDSGQVAHLRPGLWIHRISVTPSGSTPQVAQEAN